jgi:hypothetical protein
LGKNKIIILIPSYNELKTLKKICFFLKKKKFKHLVLDDNSSDKTHNWLKKNKINYIKNRKNLGYESNILKGIKKVTKLNKFKFIITFDADGQHSLSDLIRFKNYDENIDLLIGKRTKFNRWSEYILSKLFYIFLKIKDPLSGLKRYSCLNLKKRDNFFSNKLYLVDILYFFLKSKYNVKEIKISIKTRAEKELARVGGDVKVNFKIIKIFFIFLIKIIRNAKN